MLKSDSFDEIYFLLIDKLINSFDYQSSPRGKKINELLCFSFCLTNPRNRLVHSKVRNVNYGFAVGELCWYLRGDKDLETMLYYNKRMKQFSDDGKNINSAYGNRIFNSYSENSQFDNVIKELKKDNESRRAVIHINQPYDLMKAVSDSGSKDVPCTMSLQFFIREKRLFMHVYMRSNDIMWGVPYDVFSFTCIQEAMLYRLIEEGIDVEDVGHYYHTATSLHLYEDQYENAVNILDDYKLNFSLDNICMYPFSIQLLRDLVEIEIEIRKDKSEQKFEYNKNLTIDHTINWMITKLTEHREKRINESR